LEGALNTAPAFLLTTIDSTSLADGYAANNLEIALNHAQSAGTRSFCAPLRLKHTYHHFARLDTHASLDGHSRIA